RAQCAAWGGPTHTLERYLSRTTGRVLQADLRDGVQPGLLPATDGDPGNRGLAQQRRSRRLVRIRAQPWHAGGSVRSLRRAPRRRQVALGIVVRMTGDAIAAGTTIRTGGG